MRRESFVRNPSWVEPVGVLYVANASQIGGGNRVLMDLMDGVDRSRFRPVLIAPGEGPLVEWAVRAGIPTEIVPAVDWEGRVGLLQRAVTIARIIARYRARIVHAAAPMSYRAAGLAAWSTGAARVCHLGYPPEDGELEWSFRVKPDVIIACHHQQARDVAQKVRSIAPATRLVAVPNGIDVQRFSLPAATEGMPTWHPRKPVVLIVGHLSEVKGYPTFFQAAAQVVATGMDCAFVALGGETASPGYREVLGRLVGNLGLTDRVTFLGWRSDVEAVLRFADVVVMPSLAEGLPMAILEAMACARPIIATPVGGIPEAITDGRTGLLVPAADANALASAIVRLLHDQALARRLGEQARREAVSRFSVTRSVSDIEAIYAGLLTGRHDHIGSQALADTEGADRFH